MRFSEQADELIKALAAAQMQMGAVPKSGKNPEFKYTYASLSDYEQVWRPVLPEMGLTVTQGVLELVHLEPGTTRGGSRLTRVRVWVTTRISHLSGQWLEVDCAAEGQDTQDKAIPKAITQARKYGIATALGLATSDDVEAGHKSENDQMPIPAAVSSKPSRKTNPISSAIWKLARERAKAIGHDNAEEIVRSVLGDLGYQTTTEVPKTSLTSVLSGIDTWEPMEETPEPDNELFGDTGLEVQDR